LKNFTRSSALTVHSRTLLNIEYGEDQQSLQPEPDIDRVLTVAPEKDVANAQIDMAHMLMTHGHVQEFEISPVWNPR